MIIALPDFVKRIANANTQFGEPSGDFKIWPSAHPAITLERGKAFSFWLRIRPAGEEARKLLLTSGAAGTVKYKLSDEGNGYKLSVDVDPMSEAGTRSVPILLKPEGADSEGLAIELSLNVLGESLVHTPDVVDLGKVSLSNLNTFSPRLGRAGIRKLAGTFHPIKLESSLPFLRLSLQTVVEGSNYVVKIEWNPESHPVAGRYNGVLRVDTDDPQNPRVEIPCKVTIVDR